MSLLNAAVCLCERRSGFSAEDPLGVDAPERAYHGDAWQVAGAEEEHQPWQVADGGGGGGGASPPLLPSRAVDPLGEHTADDAAAAAVEPSSVTLAPSAAQSERPLLLPLRAKHRSALPPVGASAAAAAAAKVPMKQIPLLSRTGRHV